MRLTSRAGIALAAILLLTLNLGVSTPAVAAEPAPAGGESLDVLRQRLSEKLTKEPPPSGAVKIVGKGGKDAAAKPSSRKASAAAAARPAPPWAYDGDGGPDHWAALSPDNRLCAGGQRQSPIDAKDTIKVDLEKIRFDYAPRGFAVLDTGRTIQVTPEAGNVMEVMGRRFELQQISFHRPAEMRLNGRQFDMSAQLLHRDAQGRLAVLVVLLDRDLDNRPQPAVQLVWNNLPLEQHAPLTAAGPALNLAQLLPEDRSYLTFMGSLTTPPCTEDVLWLVMRQPVLLTKSQIDIFAKLYPMNARPVQPANGRLIKESQ